MWSMRSWVDCLRNNLEFAGERPSGGERWIEFGAEEEEAAVEVVGDRGRSVAGWV